ncbi:MAG: hypothetical protein KAI24_15225, partial [Planctomycetes bacterium]|nr:hypothetical protein [Planctomycetota bacterium]
MNRTLSLLACAALAAAPAAAQCFTATGTSIAAQMVPTSFWAAHDEGVSPDQALGFPFPLGGVNWTHLVVSSNGAVYLTDGTGAIGVPDFGMPSLAALRGAAGDSPRICPFAADLEAIPNSSTWDILVDTSVSGEIKVTWVGVQHYFAPTAEDFSFSVKLTAAGVVEFSYEGTNYGTPGVFDWVAVSAGNGVGTGTEPVSDLSGNADSGAVEVIYENGWPNGFDLNGLSISIVSNGTGGLLSFRSCGIARHEAVGDGCHDLARESFYQWFTDAGVASTTLSGNGIALSRTADGYTASWIPGVASALYVPPSSGATLLAVLNDDEVTFTPAAGFPIPGGTVSELTVQGNGIVAFGAGPTEPLVDNWIPTPQGMLDGSHGGVYFWHPYNEEEGGDVFAEEVGGVIYVTFQDVENFPLGTVNPSTWQL